MVLQNRVLHHRVIVFAFTLLNIHACFAQQSPKLRNVVKFEFISKLGGFFTSNYKRYEVIKEGSNWNCYQTRLFEAHNLKTKSEIRDSTRKFITVIPKPTLHKLLNYINRPDSGICLSAFHIKKGVLVRNIDSLNFLTGPRYYSFNSYQRNKFIKLLHSRRVINEAVRTILHHRQWDDENMYYIITTLNGGQKFTVEAHDFSYPYFLPWFIGNVKSYNPRITVIFETILGDADVINDEKTRLYRDIDRQVYREYLN